NEQGIIFSSRRRHTSLVSDWSADVCSSDLLEIVCGDLAAVRLPGQIAIARNAVCGAVGEETAFDAGIGPIETVDTDRRFARGERSEERRVGKGCTARGSARQ